MTPLDFEPEHVFSYDATRSRPGVVGPAPDDGRIRHDLAAAEPGTVDGTRIGKDFFNQRIATYDVYALR